MKAGSVPGSPLKLNKCVVRLTQHEQRAGLFQMLPVFSVRSFARIPSDFRRSTAAAGTSRRPQRTGILWVTTSISRRASLHKKHAVSHFQALSLRWQHLYKASQRQ